MCAVDGEWTTVDSNGLSHTGYILSPHPCWVGCSEWKLNRYWSTPELVMQSHALYLMHQNNIIHDCFLLTMACLIWTMTQTVQAQLYKNS